MLHLVSDKFVQ